MMRSANPVAARAVGALLAALVVGVVVGVVVVGVGVGACGGDTTDAGSDDGDGEGEGPGEGEGEGPSQTFGSAGLGDDCGFNADCGAGLRCGCEGGFCACELGERGIGQNGVDVCVDENDCGSALCVEDSQGTFTCSDECDDDGDCGPRLPRCLDVAFVGRICVRAP